MIGFRLSRWGGVFIGWEGVFVGRFSLVALGEAWEGRSGIV